MKIRLNTCDGAEAYVYAKTHFNKQFSKTRFKRNRQCVYYDMFGCLDTETSHNHNLDEPVAWIYQWAFVLGGQYIIGRTPTRLFKELRRIQRMYQLDDHRKIVIYIHNLSYDFCYLYSYMEEYLGERPEVLALNNRKILMVSCGGFEFRCSYLLSNMSLDEWTKQLKTNVRKMVGAIDYDTIHYQDEELDIVDWEYQINDIASQYEALQIEMQIGNHTIVDIPLTSTGYVRLDMKRVCRDKEYRDFFKKTRLDVDTYKACKMAFAGGYTHANRCLVGVNIKYRIGHFDFKSHYPSVQQLRYFPISKFDLYYEYNKEDKLEVDEIIDILNEYCCLIQVAFNNPSLHPEVTAPYMQQSKILNAGYQLRDDRGIKATDNGRIINIDGTVLMWLTELDFKILIDQYEFDDIEIIKMYIAKRGPIPMQYIDNINKYFEIKENGDKDTVYYQKSKAKLNAIYGMTATDICRPNIHFDFDTGEYVSDIISDTDISDMLDKYYGSRNNFNPYQFGVWTTAHARYLLMDLIKNVIGYENYIYSDTDSIFFLDSDKIRKKIDAYNQNVIALNASLSKGVKNRNNTISYYGTFEDEKDDIVEFRTLHSKCYAFNDADNNMHVTIAGVTKSNKKQGDERVTIADELQVLENLREGFQFNECGGTRSVYYSHPASVINYNGHKIEYSSGVIITPTTKTISEYREVVELYDREY